MGANSRRRRAARNRGAAPPGGRDPLGAEDPFDDYDAPGAHFVVEAAVLGVARRIGARSLTSAELAECFLGLRRRIGPCPPFLLTLVLSEVLDRLVHDLFDGGWSRDDLVELVRRRAGAEYLPALHAALDGEDAIDPDSRVAQALALRVVALLGCAPPVTVGDLLDFGAERDRRPEHPKLARVRALLAKAESTEYDEEAEALTAKAQELITKYSLDELVDHGAGGGTGLQLRRLWIDPPYVRAKASLVHEVADANRCRSAVTDSLGFCLLVGAPADLAAV